MEEEIQKCFDAIQDLHQLLPRVGRHNVTTILSLLEQAIYLAAEGSSQGTDPPEEIVPSEQPLSEVRYERHPPLSLPDTGSLPEESTPQESPVEYSQFEADSTALQSPVTIGRHWSSEEDSSGEEPVPVPRSRDTTPDGNGQQPPAKRKRALRSKGGSQRTYLVDSRGHASYTEERWGVCSLTHVISQNPKAMVLYAAGEDVDKFVCLASHCLMADKFELPQPILEDVAALLRLSEVHNPLGTLPPSNLSEEGLSEWSCVEHLEHLLRLIHLPLTIRLLADYHIGQYLNFLRGTEGQKSLAVLCRLCTVANRQQTTEYLHLLRECYCSDCRCDLEWIEERSTSPRPEPCRTTQLKAKVLNDCYKNCTPTYLSQCCSFASAVHHSHPVLLQRQVAPNRVRQLAPELKRELTAMKSRGECPSQSNARLGQGVVFKLEPAVAIQAIDYVDGDGGYLVAELIPGLKDFVDGLEVQSLEVFRDHQYTLVAFREMYHDAVELNHVYRHHERRSPCSLGVESLRLARASIANSQVAYVCCDRRVDFYRKRLLVEVLLLKDHHIVSNGELMISRGLSVSLNDAPQSYRNAQSEAEREKAGVYSIFPLEVANMSSMRPEALRAQFPEAVDYEGETYSVTANSPLRNESHVCVRKSNIQGAGNGLFLRACPPRRQAAGEDSDTSQVVTVKGNSHLCVYSNERITREEYTRLPNTDYVMECSHGIFNPQIYDGKNIGRFVNQGGLIPAFKTMVRISSRHRYPQGINWRDVEATADRHCNISYCYRQRVGLYIQLKRDTRLLESSVELLGNYSIQGYWVPYFASKVEELGTSNDCVAAVLWCACSAESNWTDEDKRGVHQHLVAGGITPANYANILCPWPPAQ